MLSVNGLPQCMCMWDVEVGLFIVNMLHLIFQKVTQPCFPVAFFIFLKCFTWHLPINSFHQIIVILWKNTCESCGYAPPQTLLRPSLLPPATGTRWNVLLQPWRELTVGRWLQSPFSAAFTPFAVTPFTPDVLSPSGCLQAVAWLFPRLRLGLAALLGLLIVTHSIVCPDFQLLGGHWVPPLHCSQWWAEPGRTWPFNSGSSL